MMEVTTLYKTIQQANVLQKRLLAILIDPDKFKVEDVRLFLQKLPSETSHLFVGGSTVQRGKTSEVIKALKLASSLPIVVFPGDYSQISKDADALLFLTLISGRNPEYLIGQHIKAIPLLRNLSIEVIPTAYLLVDGKNKSAVARVSQTKPMPQDNVQAIIDTAKAGELQGAKLLYLEAGSGAKVPVHPSVINAVSKEICVPLIVGGGVKTKHQIEQAYTAGATMVVMGTFFETNYTKK